MVQLELDLNPPPQQEDDLLVATPADMRVFQTIADYFTKDQEKEDDPKTD